MKQITYITVQDLKENSIIQSNVNEKILHQSILEFQELELEPLLGKNLYRRLSNVLVSGATISGFKINEEDTELLNYIKPFMVYGSLVYSLSPLHYQVTNKGVQRLIDDSSQNADKSDIESLRSSYLNKKDAYKGRLTEYMSTDDREETEITSCSALDTTFNFTGISLSDSVFDENEAYRSSYYKTGYYRRRLY